MIFADGDSVRASFTIDGKIFRVTGESAVIFTGEGYSRKIPLDSLTLLGDGGQPIECTCESESGPSHSTECPAFRG